jgi:hypothetical protein
MAPLDLMKADQLCASRRSSEHFWLGWDEEKCGAVFRPHPALNIGIDHIHDFGSIRSKLIVI